MQIASAASAVNGAPTKFTTIQNTTASCAVTRGWQSSSTMLNLTFGAVPGATRYVGTGGPVRPRVKTKNYGISHSLQGMEAEAPSRLVPQVRTGRRSAKAALLLSQIRTLTSLLTRELVAGKPVEPRGRHPAAAAVEHRCPSPTAPDRRPHSDPVAEPPRDPSTDKIAAPSRILDVPQGTIRWLGVRSAERQDRPMPSSLEKTFATCTWIEWTTTGAQHARSTNQ